MSLFGAQTGANQILSDNSIDYYPFSVEHSIDSCLKGVTNVYDDIVSLNTLQDNGNNKVEVQPYETDMPEILSNFVDNILSNTKPLDPDFSKLVDDNFWDLV
jgi:hypothetical protein